MKINDIKKYLTKSLDKAKMFANIAVSKKSQRGERTRQLLTGIFYACFIIYGFVTPCEKLMLSRPLCGDGQRVSYGTVFFISRTLHKFFQYVRNREKEFASNFYTEGVRTYAHETGTYQKETTGIPLHRGKRQEQGLLLHHQFRQPRTIHQLLQATTRWNRLRGSLHGSVNSPIL